MCIRTRSQSGLSEKGTPSRPVLAQKILQQSREAETALSDALVSTLYHDSCVPYFNKCINYL